jgi:hypothetical protein
VCLLDQLLVGNLLVRQFPEDPVLEAAQRADSTYEAGDMFNFRLWTRIATVVGELLRTRPADAPLN